jgi:hypothetical protein
VSHADYQRPTRHELTRALARFEDLLSRPAKEAEFQRLFRKCPYALSRGLPLGVAPSQILPLGRPGKSEPDFLAFPAHDLGRYAIIELKRPDSAVLRRTRKDVLQLSADARTAVSQSERYSERLERREALTENVHRRLTGPLLMLGNSSNILIIMGLQQDLVDKLGEELISSSLRRELPDNCSLIPYDTLRDAFAESIPPSIHVLAPSALIGSTEERLSPSRRVEHWSVTYRFCVNFVVKGIDLAMGLHIGRLEAIGESVLMVGDKRLIRVHLHTDKPEEATAIFADAGAVSRLDVTDMVAVAPRRTS